MPAHITVLYPFVSAHEITATVLAEVAEAISTVPAFDVAFNTPRVPGGPVSFMVNNHQWAVYGALAVVVGVGQVIWSNSRRAK